MRSMLFITLFLKLFTSSSIAQVQYPVDSLLDALCFTRNSKDLSTQPPAQKLISYGRNILPVLAGFFIDTTLTSVQSDCHNSVVTKGEVAIILADRIEGMPYHQLTGIQNCSLEFCKDNPNRVEYYLNAIRNRPVKDFQDRYRNWLTSKERKKWNRDSDRWREKKE